MTISNVTLPPSCQTTKNYLLSCPIKICKIFLHLKIAGNIIQFLILLHYLMKTVLLSTIAFIVQGNINYCRTLLDSGNQFNFITEEFYSTLKLSITMSIVKLNKQFNLSLF